MSAICTIIDPRALEVQESINGGEAVLKAIRRSLKMTQTEFSQLLMTDVSTLRRWESGKNEPTFTIAQVKALYGALNQIGIPLENMPDSLKPQVKGSQ